MLGSSLKCWSHAHVISLFHLTFSLLMFHPCLLLLFLDGHFETTLDCYLDDLTDVSVHTILPNFPDLKALVKRTPHEDEQSGYLAKSVPNTRTAGRKRSCPQRCGARADIQSTCDKDTGCQGRDAQQVENIGNIQLGPSTVKPKDEVIYKARKEGRIVHCGHLQNTKWKDEKFSSLL